MGIISASMASALLAPQLSLSTAADKLLECPEPLVPSGTDMRSTEAPLDVKCLASEVEQSAAAALLGLCTSTAQSMEGSTDSSPASPARDDSESFRFNTMPGLLNSWDSAPSSSTGSPRPRNSKDGAPPPGSCRFQCRYPGCSISTHRLTRCASIAGKGTSTGSDALINLRRTRGRCQSLRFIAGGAWPREASYETGLASMRVHHFV